MKKLLITLSCLLLVLALFGCGKQEAEPDTGAAGAPEEMADSTRLDSAAAGLMDSAAAIIDSAAGEVKEAVEGAVDEVTGH